MPTVPPGVQTPRLALTSGGDTVDGTVWHKS